MNNKAVYDFDKVINRKLSKCRKWDNDILKSKFNVDENAIPMDLADLDFECAPAIKDALVNRAMLGDYGYSYCYDEYYDAVIDWNKRRFSLEIEKDWIKLAFGTCSVLHYIVQCFCDVGDSVIINTPAYKPFADSVLRAGCKLILNPLKLIENRYYFDFEMIEKQMIENNVKIFSLCSPQNPSGRVWTKEELCELSELCMKYKVLLVSDEIHRDIIFPNHEFTTLWNANDTIAEHSILCVSLNKGFNLGGLKSSYIVIKDKNIRNKMLNYLQKVYVTSPHVFVVPATIAAYNESEDWLNQLTMYIAKNFEFVYTWFATKLPDANVMKADSSFLLWVDMNKIVKSEEQIIKFLIASNVTAVVGSAFVADGNQWVRFNIGTQLSVLKEAFSRMEKQIYLLNQ
ncbi:MAG: aminotransferase class I/II-fold pyridoxal phosphate-dependent enzyme [Longicatena sp.]